MTDVEVCPICLDVVMDGQDCKGCPQCVCRQHPECFRETECPMCRYVYDKPQRDAARGEIVENYQYPEYQDYADADRFEESTGEDDEGLFDEMNWEEYSREMYYRMLSLGYDRNYLLSVLPAQSMEVSLQAMFQETE